MYLAKTAIRLFPWAPGENAIKIKEKKLQQDVTIYQIITSITKVRTKSVFQKNKAWAQPEVLMVADLLYSAITPISLKSSKQQAMFA